MKSMRPLSIVLLTTACLSAMAVGQTKIKLSNMHICCKSCIKGIDKAIQGVPGITHTIDKKAGTTELTAPDDATAQKAVDAIGAAGYHATSDHASVKLKDDSGAPAGKVTQLAISGIHNCCGGCAKAFVKAVASVPGTKKPTVAKKAKTFEVAGDFVAAALVKALNAAGFHVKVK
jgi:mercuric ion binding protein